MDYNNNTKFDILEDKIKIVCAEITSAKERVKELETQQKRRICIALIALAAFAAAIVYSMILISVEIEQMFFADMLYLIIPCLCIFYLY